MAVQGVGLRSFRKGDLQVVYPPTYRRVTKVYIRAIWSLLNNSSPSWCYSQKAAHNPKP